MGKIRKKTSNRTSVRKREKVKKRVVETRKKKAKEAKKNPQWKSKKPVDPGIPKNFPYKDRILAEVAEGRRRDAEEKARKKEAKNEPIVFDGVSNVYATTSGIVATVEEEEEIPILVDTSLTNLQQVLEKADGIIQVLDARDPLSCRSSFIEQFSKNKKFLFVLNKIDLVPKESLLAWTTVLRSQHPTVLFRSAIQNALGTDHISHILSTWAKEKDEPLHIAVVGIPNSGKSSLINAILHRPLLPTYAPSASIKTPSTTTHIQIVECEIQNSLIRFMDSPGYLFDEQVAAKDMLLRNRGNIARIKDPLPAAEYLVTRAHNEDLMIYYNLPVFKKNDRDAFLTGVARSKGLIKKMGTIIDLQAAARSILRDWHLGKFYYYTMPSPTTTPAIPLSFDEDPLSVSKSRREFRKSVGGLVQFKLGQIDDREPFLDPSDEGHEGEEGGEEGGEGSQEEEAEAEGEEEEGGDEAEEGNDDDEEEVQKPTFGKRKRQGRQRPDPPKKPTLEPLSKPLRPPKTLKAPKTLKPTKPLKIANSAPKKAPQTPGEAYDFTRFFNV